MKIPVKSTKKKSKNAKISKKTTKTPLSKISTTVDQSLYKKIKSLAMKQKISVSKLIYTAIQTYFK